MIRIIIDAEHRDPSIDGMTIDVEGNPFEISAEFGIAIGDIYNSMKKTDAGMALAFRKTIQAAVSDRAPTWEITLPMTPGSSGFRAIIPRRRK